MHRLPLLMLCASGLAQLCLAGHNDDAWPQREQESIQKTLTLSGGPQRVVIDNIEGYVHVTGTDGNQVHVRAHKSIRAAADTDLQQAKQEVKLEISEKPGEVSVYYDAPWRCDGDKQPCHGGPRRFYRVIYDIDVELPRGAYLVASTVNEGDIRVERTAGNFDISDINGGINMTGISGAGSIRTINGPVVVKFDKNPVAATSFKTLNGQVDVYFQPGLSADLLFKTFNGEVFADFDVGSRSIQQAAAEKRDGKYVYRSNEFRGGTAGRGGPELKFDAFNGNIRLHQAAQ